jgi:hypothetical protein
MMNGKMSEAFSGVSSLPERSANPATAPAVAPNTTKIIKAINRVAYGFPKLLVEEQIKQQLR